MIALKPLDAAFLRLENDHASLCIASVAVFEGPMPDRSVLTAHLTARTRSLPRFRQVLRESPGHLGAPRWREDPKFDIAEHLCWAALPSPNSEADLDEFIGRIMSVPMDRDRPLWETWFVDGLAGERWVMVSKIHHSMVDGVGGAELLAALLTVDESVETPRRRDTHRGDTQPAPRQTWRTELLGRATRTVRASVLTARGLLHFAGLAVPAPESFLVGTIGRRRGYATASISFDDINLIRERFGGTINDVVLSASSRAFHDLLAANGVDPGAVAVRTLVPVSARGATRGTEDNHVTAMVANLPVAETDAALRLTAVQAEMHRLKTSGEAQAGTVVTAVLGRLPQGPVNAALSAVFALPQWFITTVTTNVPGSRAPMSLCGCPMVALYPYVPIADRIRVGIAVASYHDALYVGVTTDLDHIAPAPLAASMRDEVRELARMARVERTAQQRRDHTTTSS